MGSYRDYSTPKRLKVTYSTTKVLNDKEGLGFTAFRRCAVYANLGVTGFKGLTRGLEAWVLEGSNRRCGVSKVDKIRVPFWVLIIVNPRKLEHGFRRIGARIPYTLP